VSEIKIPMFIQHMGNQIIAYILNLSVDDVIQLNNGDLELDPDRQEVLNTFIKISRDFRMEGIEQGDLDFYVILRLADLFKSGRHIFTLMHELLGGDKINIETDDALVNIASSLAIELYPVFLFKSPKNSYHFFKNRFHQISSSLYRLERNKEFFDAILNDDSLKEIFSNVGDSDMNTFGDYLTSSGRGGGLQLSGFLATIIFNAYELMQLRGCVSKENLTNCVKEVIEILRSTVDGTVVEVPVFVGFHNVGFNDVESIDLSIGKIRQYTEAIIELIPHEARPSGLGGENQKLGFILETSYPYKVDYSPIEPDKKKKWPKELHEAHKHLDQVQENLSLIFPMAIDRSPPIGISSAWTLIFDPISPGTNISWSNKPKTPMPHFLIEKNNVDAIIYWSKLIDETDDEKIRIAIRRILSSINDRINPIDGFVDSIIAWENLFGGMGELCYRISISISKLLHTDPDERLTLQREIVKFYNDRSKIVHGAKEIGYEEAEIKRNRCLNIAISSLKSLYEKHADLIADEERSKKLALM
jgi:hypothetical protein